MIKHYVSLSVNPVKHLDTLAALKEAKRDGAKYLGQLTNVVGSSISREQITTVYTMGQVLKSL